MSPPLIVVADPSAAARHTVRTVLTAKGCEVVDAPDHETLLAVLSGRRPDVVLLDVDGPETGGLTTLDTIRADPTLRRILVILLAGGHHSEAVEAGIERGAEDYLTKPIAGPELAARVASALRISAAIDRLDERNRELDQFAVKAAHDMKSPLTVIQGAADILRIAWDRLPEETRNEQFESMSRAARRAATLVDDLLALARFEAPSEVAEPTDARAAVDRVLADGGEAERVIVDGEFGKVALPEADLDAVLRNVIENARHYGRSPDGALDLRVTGRLAADHLVIDITDGGPGIPEEMRSRLFEAFYRGPRSRDFNPSSTGVGLAIVRRAVERWAGEVDVAAAPGGGTRFTLVLPAG
jgi:signal transduction histidine kinase